jgi:hypothetical protein
MSRELSANELALAIAIAVSHRRTRMTRHRRAQTAYIDDCFEMLEKPALNPKVRRFADGVVRIADAKRARLCGETREMYEAMEPVIRALEDA